MISNELHKEERFRIPQLLQQHGVKSGQRDHQDQGEHLRRARGRQSRARTFAEHDLKFLQGYATLLAFAIEQARLNDLHAQLAAQNELLLQELHHRIKNNNQSLISLIHLQLANVTNLDARENLEKIEHRIRALSLVNAQLQAGARADLVDLGQYLMAIIASLFNFQNGGETDVKLDADRSGRGVDRARAGDRPDPQRVSDQQLQVRVRRGHGRTSACIWRTRAAGQNSSWRTTAPACRGARPGLGLSLIDILTKQIEGEARWDTPGRGTQLMLEFPIRIS